MASSSLTHANIHNFVDDLIVNKQLSIAFNDFVIRPNSGMRECKLFYSIGE